MVIAARFDGLSSANKIRGDIMDVKHSFPGFNVRSIGAFIAYIFNAVFRRKS